MTRPCTWTLALAVSLELGLAAFCFSSIASGADQTRSSSNSGSAELFSGPLGSPELAAQRGGESSPVDSFNTNLNIDSQQTVSATNDGNTINAGGNVSSGDITIQADALSNMSGMSNVVINSAPQSNVQGAMTLNLILQQTPSAP